MAHISDLPDEILLDIFEHVRSTSPSSILKAMLCNRSFHRVGVSILYRHVDLEMKLRDDTCTAKFATMVDRSNFGLVQSLSLRFSQVYLMGASIESPESIYRLTEVLNAFPRLKRLQSFSLAMEAPTEGGQSFSVPTTTITSLLHKLPNTVINLNIDCEQLNTFPLTQNHLCEAVGAFLPRLRSLRLRIPYLCRSLFSKLYSQKGHIQNSQLEHMVIRLDLPSHARSGTHTCRCWSYETHTDASELCQSVLRVLQEHGRFPRLRRFVVIERMDKTLSVHNEHWNVFKVREMTPRRSTTTTFPWCPRGGSSSLFMIRDSRGDWFGSFDDISKSLEGPLAGIGTSLHQPRQQYRSGQSKSKSWTLKHDALSSRQTVTEYFGVSFRLWKHEELTNTKLLYVRTSTGFDDTTGLSELVPPGWTWVRGGPWDFTIAPVAV